MTNEATETARAIQESAKATGKAIDALQRVGGFFNRVFGGLVEDGIGIVADRVKYMRIEQAVRLGRKTEQILAQRGVETTQSVPLKIGVPLIEQATLEDNDELHTLWANLLANAMDPSTASNISRVHVSLLKEMEPIDVHILSRITQEKLENFPDQPFSEVHFERSKIAQGLETDITTVELSLLNLMRLACVTPGIITGGISIGEHKIGSYKGTEFVHLSELGMSLVFAANDREKMAKQKG